MSKKKRPQSRNKPQQQSALGRIAGDISGTIKQLAAIITVVGAAAGLIFLFVRSPLRFEDDRKRYADMLNDEHATEAQRLSALRDLQLLATTRGRARKVYDNLVEHLNTYTVDTKSNEHVPCPSRDTTTRFKVLTPRQTSAAVNAFISVRKKAAVREKPNLSGAYLPYVNLESLSLRDFNLQGTCLFRANLKGADLQGADLRQANLDSASLERANLIEANLQDAKLVGAQLNDARLRCARLARADLSEATLSGADFTLAIMPEVNLTAVRDLLNALFTGAYLESADLKDVADWSLITDLTGAYLFDVQEAPAGFIEFARQRKAVLDSLDQAAWAARKSLLTDSTRTPLRCDPGA